MVQTLPKPVTFEQFIQWYPDTGIRYELHNGVIVEMNQPLGEHEFIILTLCYSLMKVPEYWIIDYLGVGGRRFIGNPKLPTLSIYYLIDGEYQVTQFRGDELIISPTFPELNLTAKEVLLTK